MITAAEIDNWFTYHAPTSEQQAHYEAIRSGAKAFAQVLVAHTPNGPDQTVAVRKLRESVMVANAAVACEQRPHN